MCIDDRSHAQRGNALGDAQRRGTLKIGRGASGNACPRWGMGTIISWMT
ncbi:DUF1534 domain-containing protein [Pseudomonas tremae]|nr:DUF1534 domain-containing protein [Pseudomonas tremae]MCF5807715.1 DUF1534 domain-containing protein [Pseudomonas tremae]